MNRQETFDLTEAYLGRVAPRLSYPATPDVAGQVRRRLAARSRGTTRLARRPALAWGLAIIAFLLVLGALLTVPAVQAIIRSFFQIGGITVVVETATPVPPNVTPLPSPTRTGTLDLVGETTLAIAKEDIAFPIKLPSYPADLGRPDRVFMQGLYERDNLILVWTEFTNREVPRMVLYEIHGQFAQKELMEMRQVQETAVHGKRALWVIGPHWLRFYDSLGNEREGVRRLVDGNTLLWEEGNVTYRLESKLSLAEAVRVAESLTTLRDVEPLSPAKTATPPDWATHLTGATTLQEAQRRVPFAIRWPSYPSYMGDPDLVFFQERAAPMVALAWYTSGERSRIGTILYEMEAGDTANEALGGGSPSAETAVNGRPARWVASPHLLTLYDEGGAGNIDAKRQVRGMVLLWEADAIAYRLETSVDLEEALRIAESLGK